MSPLKKAANSRKIPFSYLRFFQCHHIMNKSNHNEKRGSGRRPRFSIAAYAALIVEMYLVEVLMDMHWQSRLLANFIDNLQQNTLCLSHYKYALSRFIQSVSQL